jgi:DNA polymerase III subunit delta
VKAAKQSIGRAVDQPAPGIRFYLFHGPDDAQSRGLGERLLHALGATRFVVAQGAIKSDPALLADEAGAMSLFGGARAIWIEPAGEDIVPGVEALLAANATESPVIAISGWLRKTSALLKLAESSPLALAFAAYLPEGADAERMVTDAGRRFGLKISGPVAARIAESCGNDQAIVGQEVQKLALYVDASPEAPKDLDHEAVDAVGAELDEGNLPRLADLALAGELTQLADELARLPQSAEAIPIVRALQRRLLMLAPARARIERGERVDGVMASFGKPLFFKDKPLVTRLLTTWDAKGLATIAARAGNFERELMRPRARPDSSLPPAEAVGEELFAIGREARRRRA